MCNGLYAAIVCEVHSVFWEKQRLIYGTPLSLTELQLLGQKVRICTERSLRGVEQKCCVVAFIGCRLGHSPRHLHMSRSGGPDLVPDLDVWMDGILIS